MQLYHFHDQSYHHPQLLPEMYETFRLNNFELLRTSSSGAPCGSTSCAWPARSERRGGGRGKYFHLFQTFIALPKSVQIEVNYFAISGDRTTALPWSQLGQLLDKKRSLWMHLQINAVTHCIQKTQYRLICYLMFYKNIEKVGNEIFRSKSSSIEVKDILLILAFLMLLCNLV